MNESELNAHLARSRAQLREALAFHRRLADLYQRLLIALHLPPAPLPFEPNDLQQWILQALDGKALRTDALAARVGVDRRKLYKERGIKELRALGLVDNHHDLGYFRPDAPPPELAPALAPCTCAADRAG